jgi:membrane-associated phospholipid phosphatase
VLFAAATALGLLVHDGDLRAVDHYGFTELMPLRGTDWTHTTDPVDAPIAALLMVFALVKLRERRAVAVAWAAVFAASFVVELIGKATIERPFATPGHLLGPANGTFPSGHTMRALIVAAAFSVAWPRACWLFALWAAATLVVVEMSGMHVISEVAGGILCGLALIACAWAALPRRPQPAARHSGEQVAERGQPQAAPAAR